MEASLTDSQLNGLLRELIQLSGPADSLLRRLLTEIFQAVSSILPRINDLICADTMAMSESIIIQAVYIAIGPFFVVEAEPEGKGKKAAASNVIATLGGSAMRGLRLDALSLIRSVRSIGPIHGENMLRYRPLRFRSSPTMKTRDLGS